MDVSVTIYTQNPAGTSLPFRGGTVPFGYLAEDGAVVSRTTYARLFDAIGITYGAGDGSTTFKLPDSRGRVDVGAGTGSGLTARVLGATGGAETHQLSESEMPSHTHVQNSHNHTQNAHAHRVFGSSENSPATPMDIGTPSYGIGGTASTAAINKGYFNNAADGEQFIQNTTATNQVTTATNQNTGGGATHNNMQPFLVVEKIVKY